MVVVSLGHLVMEWNRPVQLADLQEGDHIYVHASAANGTASGAAGGNSTSHHGQYCMFVQKVIVHTEARFKRTGNVGIPLPSLHTYTFCKK